MRGTLTKSRKAFYDAKLPNYTNEELLKTTLGLAGGDWYDGEFTAQGEYEYDGLKGELEKRLRDVGFLKMEETI